MREHTKQLPRSKVELLGSMDHCSNRADFGIEDNSVRSHVPDERDPGDLTGPSYREVMIRGAEDHDISCRRLSTAGYGASFGRERQQGETVSFLPPLFQR